MKILSTAPFLLAVLFAACGQDPAGVSKPSAAPSAAVATDLTAGVTIANFHQVDAHLFRSGRPEPDQLGQLKALGVRSVLSLETYVLDPDDAQAEETAANAAGMAFLRDAMDPFFGDIPTASEIEAAVDIVTDPANQPVLVHCYYGSDRTGLVVAAYHIRVDHWTPDQAIQDMRLYGHSSWYYSWDQVLYQVQ